MNMFRTRLARGVISPQLKGLLYVPVLNQEGHHAIDGRQPSEYGNGLTKGMFCSLPAAASIDNYRLPMGIFSMLPSIVTHVLVKGQ